MPGVLVSHGFKTTLMQPSFLLFEGFVSFGRLVQRQAMGDHETMDQFCRCSIVSSSGCRYLWTWVWPILKVKPLSKDRAERNFVQKSRINARHRNRAAFATRLNRLTQNVGPVGRQSQAHFDPIVNLAGTGAVRFHADGVDATRRGRVPSVIVFELIEQIVARYRPGN